MSITIESAGRIVTIQVYPLIGGGYSSDWFSYSFLIQNQATWRITGFFTVTQPGGGEITFYVMTNAQMSAANRNPDDQLLYSDPNPTLYPYHARFSSYACVEPNRCGISKTMYNLSPGFYYLVINNPVKNSTLQVVLNSDFVVTQV